MFLQHAGSEMYKHATGKKKNHSNQVTSGIFMRE